MPKSKRSRLKADSTHIDRSGGVDIHAKQVNVAGDVVGRDKIVQNITQAAPAVGVVGLHQLPPPPRDFTGREAELAELMAKAEGDGVTIFGLHGMGGVGKTALALVLADRLKERYPDAQFYLDLKGASNEPVRVAEALAHVIRAYCPTAQLPAGEDELRGLYQSALHEQSALLLMDNAADAWQVEPLIPPSSCFMLVTSRRHFHLPGLRPKNLETLPPDDARALLLKIAERIDGHADPMAKLCGYLPLALRLAGSAMAERATLTPEDYLGRLVGAQARLALVDASLSLSYDLMDADLQRAWCALSVFPDTFDLAAAAAVWDVEQEQAQDWLDALVRHSLVEWDATTARVQLHDLARVFANAKLGDGERMDAQRRHAAHYGSVLRSAGELYEKGGENVLRGLALFDLEQTNVEAGQAWAAEHASADEVAALLCLDYPDAGVYVLGLRHHPRERIQWLEAALTAARRMKWRSVEGVYLGNLGNAYQALGEYRRAIEYHEQALAIDKEIGDRRGEGITLGNLGIAYKRLGEYRRAIEYHEQWLTIAREMDDRRGKGNALGNLGLAYDALGEYHRAIEYHEQALAIAKELGDRLGEGIALGNLGRAYDALSEYRHAIEYHEQHLTIAKEMGDRQGEGNALGNLGMAYKNLGEYRRAIEYQEQSLTIATELGDRQGEGAALGSLGSAYFGLKDYPRAREYYAQQRRLVSDISDRLGEGNALWGLAICFEADKDMPQAIAHAEAALEIFTAIESASAQSMRDLLAKWRGRK